MPEQFIEIATEPTRSTGLPDIIWPTRTFSTIGNEYKSYRNVIDEDTHESSPVTRSTLQTVYSPIRTTNTDQFIDEENGIRGTTQLDYGENKRFEEETMKKVEKTAEKADKDADALYNLMFYGEDDVESSSKKKDLDQIENYEDKANLLDDIDTNFRKTVINSTHVINTSESQNTSDLDYNNQDDVNATYKTPLKQIFQTLPLTSEVSTEISSKDKVRGKRRPICNLLRLRQLNFNSPRTLPEVRVFSYVSFI